MTIPTHLSLTPSHSQAGYCLLNLAAHGPVFMAHLMDYDIIQGREMDTDKCVVVKLLISNGIV